MLLLDSCVELQFLSATLCVHFWEQSLALDVEKLCFNAILMEDDFSTKNLHDQGNLVDGEINIF